jgi:hypothetical protein
MKNVVIVLDYAAFAIRYGAGHLYLDRCGQCLLDIERKCPGWGLASVDLQAGRVQNPSKDMYADFNNSQFNFMAAKTDARDMGEIAQEISNLWTIVQANLALYEFVRMGFRLNFMLPVSSIEEGEALLRRSEINVKVPQALENSGHSIKNRQIILVLLKNSIEYRLELAVVTRHEGMEPSALIKEDPRALSKGQREFRLAKIKQLAEYSANPMFAVSLNVDCARYDVETPLVEEFILEQALTVKKDFLPILERIWAKT